MIRPARGRRGPCVPRRSASQAGTAANVERKPRETRLYQLAPISPHQILRYVAENVLSLPRSF
ncbi:MAG: hypothetical protein AB7O95_09230 [Geminicoccaceae bacterium]